VTSASRRSAVGRALSPELVQVANVPGKLSHQQYLSGSKNPDGYCGLGGTGVKLGDPFETNWGTSCPTGVAPAPEVTEL
jgi:peptide-methionine (S)-S-oxide reductase